LVALYSNVCSLRNKLDELRQLAQQVDLVGLAETWLGQNEHVNFPGFVIHRDDRTCRMGGGCALLVGEHLPHSRREIFQPSDNIQVVVCDILLENVVRVICVYRSPNATDSEDVAFLENLKRCVSGYQRWVLVGDLNAPAIDWHYEVTNSRASFEYKLLEVFHELSAYQHVRCATRFREGCSPSLLDLLMTPYESDVGRVDICQPLGKSDHVVI
jgi:hypothetical protein